MKIEVEIISRELIKPSSPTPGHLRHHQLSFLDQVQVPFIIPCVLFYSKKPNTNSLETCNMLKQSLRQVLTIFYPLAGRLQNNSYVNCNDEGFLFVEAKANCQLSVILRERNPYNNKNLAPVEHDDPSDLAAFCQITLFNCGGLAISFAMRHKIGDALSHFMFLNTWAAIVIGKTDINIPSFGWAALFPPTSMPAFKPENLDVKEKIVTRILVFDPPNIEALIAKYTMSGVRPSRVAALSAFIWRRFMASTKAEEAEDKLYSMAHVVNLRSRVEPPLPNLSFGNFVWFARAEADMEDKDDDSYGIIKSMTDSLRNLDADFVKKMKNTDEHLNLLKSIAREYGKQEVLAFSSVCNFPAYEADFGWGKPLWIGIIPNVGRNMVQLADTRDGQGIEAWISLTEDDMAKFERDNELLAHVSSSSSSTIEIPLHA